MKAASSCIRKLTAAATSSGLPARRAGISLSTSSIGKSCVMSVSIRPGATQLTVMLRLASSSASALVAPMMPALAALDHGHGQGVQHVVKAVQIGLEDTVPILAGDGRESIVARDACIADHAVIGAVLFDVAQQDFCCLHAFRNVELQDARGATHRFDVLGHCLGGIAPAVAVQDDVIAIARQAQCDGFADAPAGAGDQDGFPRCACVTCHASLSRNALASCG